MLQINLKECPHAIGVSFYLSVCLFLFGLFVCLFFSLKHGLADTCDNAFKLSPQHPDIND